MWLSISLWEVIITEKQSLCFLNFLKLLLLFVVFVLGREPIYKVAEDIISEPSGKHELHDILFRREDGSEIKVKYCFHRKI
jgi:hypothetical protein